MHITGEKLGLHGAGVFGHWGVDEAGRVCYHYDPPADRDAPHEDHWHLVGNQYINATCHNAGYVQLYDWSRGPKLLNRWHPASRNFAGGFVYVRAHGVTFPTLKHWLPPDAAMTRTFGQGYFRKRTRWRGLLIEELITPGEGPSIAMQVRLENETGDEMEVLFTPFWQANVHQLMVGPIMAKGWAATVEWVRARLNMGYRYQISGSRCEDGIRVKLHPAFRIQRNPLGRAIIDPFPGDLLFTDPHFDKDTPGLVHCPREFFGLGGAESPDGLQPVMPANGSTARRATGAGPLLLSCKQVPLAAGMEKQFRVGFGMANGNGNAGSRIQVPMPIKVDVPEHPWLARELEWHSYYLQAATVYSEYFDAYFVDQGSAYGYVQGASGAPRDFALFVLPLVYLNPPLAKDMLRFILRSQRHGNGGFPYAIFGHGRVSGGGVHSKSSDLDLFVMWGLAEYLNVTRDIAFLDEVNVYYPKSHGKSGTVLDHIRASWRHLTHKVGLGPHGLIRCGTGDWNDVLLAFAKVGPLTVLRGESSLNAGLATVALPAMATALQQADPQLAAEMREYAQAQAKALRQMWTGQWVARGFTGLGDQMLGVDNLFLDTQAFGVLGGVWDKEQCDTLFANIRRICVDPQPAGALALYPPMKGPLLQPGSDTNGGTWAAVDGWTTLAWMKHDPKAAWDFFLRTTMAARAEAYPENWYGIWSGPDTFNAHYHPRPAETFNFNATPMTLFPVMNQNRHAMPLYCMIKFAGIEAPNGTMTFGASR